MIAVEGLAVRQGPFTLADVSFAVPTGKYAVLTGRTGSGKTTLLEVIAGLRRPTAGRVLLRGRDVSELPPAARTLGYVPQDGAVFRTMTVRNNLAFGLTTRGAADIEARVGELASWLGLGAILDRKAVGLSGGEAQRVALGRALAFRPDVLLLDEPLSSLDEATHAELLELLSGLRKTGAVTVLHVTHSRAEADRVADVALRIDGGRVTVA